MADRYQDRPFPTNADHDRGANPYVRGESDPLAELAQLIGQTDPFGTPAKPPLPLQSRANVRPQYAPAEEEASAPAGPPPWMQRARQEAPPQQEYEEPEPEYQPSPVHPLHRYAAPPAAASEQDHHEPQDADEQPADPSRYETRFMARSNPSSRKMLAILTPINAAMSRSRASAAVGW